MNKTRMLELADALEAAKPRQFDMNSFVGKYKVDKAGRRRYIGGVKNDEMLPALKEMSCGTSACIAGWAVHLHPRAGLSAAWTRWFYEDYYDVEQHARAILGLTEEEAYTLFHSRWRQTNKQAAAFIRRCVELGTVPEPRGSR